LSVCRLHIYTSIYMPCHACDAWVHCAGLQHTTIADLVGDNVDSWLNNRNTHNLLLLYWSDCQHCDDLMPAYEALAQRIDQAHG
jgi:hypothetical protein